jgi:hypothetical protein
MHARFEAGSAIETPEGMVDIVMQRETRSFRVPVSQATLPVTLFSTEGALAKAVPPVETVAAVEGPDRAPAGALEPSLDDEQDPRAAKDLSDFDDEDTDGAASIAGRLRPALPRA